MLAFATQHCDARRMNQRRIIIIRVKQFRPAGLSLRRRASGRLEMRSGLWPVTRIITVNVTRTGPTARTAFETSVVRPSQVLTGRARAADSELDQTFSTKRVIDSERSAAAVIGLSKLSS